MGDKENKGEEIEKGEQEKKKSKPKGCLILLVILLFIIGGLVGAWKYLTAEESQETKLLIESGQVEVNGIKAKNNQVLASGDTIKTLGGGQATIAFAQGTELRLDENSEIKINAQEDKISVFLSLGRTWSRVVSLLGVQVDYEVQTSELVASVRGTAFLTEKTSEATELDVDEGTVQADNTAVAGGTGLTADRFKRLTRRALRREIMEGAWVAKNRELDRKLLERVQKRQSSIRQVFRGFAAVSPADIAKLRALAQKAQAGAINVSEAQANQLENLDYKNPADIAQALAIIDPDDFGDTVHWTRVLRVFMPFIERFGVERVLREE